MYSIVCIAVTVVNIKRRNIFCLQLPGLASYSSN